MALAYATLVTGLLMSLGTKWGLFRHDWVIISLVLTVVAPGDSPHRDKDHRVARRGRHRPNHHG